MHPAGWGRESIAVYHDPLGTLFPQLTPDPFDRPPTYSATSPMASSKIDLNYRPRLPKHKDAPIGCIGSGFIMADCHLVAYRQAGFNPVAIASRSPTHAREIAV